MPDLKTMEQEELKALEDWKMQMHKHVTDLNTALQISIKAIKEHSL
jgi:hypothetical protein